MLALSIAALAFGAAPAAHAAEQVLTYRTAPVTLPGYFTVINTVRAPSPQVDGYVTGISAVVVDTAGNEVPYTDVMLHHVVIVNASRPDVTCSNYTNIDGQHYPFAPERFYAEGEERYAMALPGGYGYPNKGSDFWGMVYMLMNHHATPQTVAVQYTIHYVTDQQLTPVRPYWLDVKNCKGDPVFDVPGTGGPGSTYSQSADFKVNEPGRIVAVGGHVHGGGVSLNLTNATCGQSLFTSWPTWGLKTPLPVLHETGPAHTSSFTSADGIPFSAGDTLRLTATYDDSLPHTRVMGIMIAYVAPGAAAGCATVPPLQLDLGQPGPPPLVPQPLATTPTGPQKDTSTAWVGNYQFSQPRVVIKAGTRFRWRFLGPEIHDVTLAAGPVGFSSPYLTKGKSFSYKFTKPGTYKLYCSLHPVAMTQIVVVR